uniref:sensory neuron membrane protein 2-like n=1 Tax=Osmia lignaria TaxID=473952 RepID=UPI00147867A8|nr:sensory neuron membrane protein 2-like [Osmia lignaria]
MLLSFACYLFNVTNPDEVMRGENPRMIEYGPFSYDEIQEKQIIEVDEERDEIKYTTRSTYIFNKYKSINVSKHDKVTILNPAYIGTIKTLTSLPPDFMHKYGNSIPKLFQNHSTIFLKARATDLLFGGVKVTCNRKKYPELNLICNTLEANPPPVLREGDREDVYYLSIFQRMNGSLRGPFTVSRGLQDISKLGDITSYVGDRVQTLWNTESCNTVKGTDTVTWAPLVEPLPFVSTFIPEMCRTIEADYENDVSIHGITGSQFIMKERGLTDVTNCQKVPIILSEPHFLHADPEVLNYARGLVPNKDLHKTYIVIEPYTGTPLSGQKKTQLNLKLTRQPVELLSNVSEGYFPIMWCENVRFS